MYSLVISFNKLYEIPTSTPELTSLYCSELRAWNRGTTAPWHHSTTAVASKKGGCCNVILRKQAQNLPWWCDGPAAETVPEGSGPWNMNTQHLCHLPSTIQKPPDPVLLGQWQSQCPVCWGCSRPYIGQPKIGCSPSPYYGAWLLGITIGTSKKKIRTQNVSLNVGTP